MPSAAATAQLSNPVMVPAAVERPALGRPSERVAQHQHAVGPGSQDQKRCGDCELQ